MTKASDIANLFARFGGKPEAYQELSGQSSLSEARQRWPLLRAIDGDGVTHSGAMAQPAPMDAEPKTEPKRRPAFAKTRPPEPEVELEEIPVRPKLGAAKAPVRAVAKPAAKPLAALASSKRPAPVAAPVAEAKPQPGRVADVFNRLAGRKEPEPAPKSSGLFGAMRRVGRK